MPEPLLDKKYSMEAYNFAFNTTNNPFPIFEKYYELQKAHLWFENIVPNIDEQEFNSMAENEKYLIKNILGFFAFADGIILSSIDYSFLSQITPSWARRYYNLVEAVEYVHQATYDKLLVNFLPNIEERDKLRNALKTMPAVSEKALWTLNNLDNKKSLAHKVVSLFLIEGIFFAGSFATIEYFARIRSLLVGSLGLANSEIMVDELTVHRDAGIEIYNNYIVNKLSEEELLSIVKEVVEIEQRFIDNIFTQDLPSLKKEEFKQYIEYIGDYILQRVSCKPFYNVENPLVFMEQYSISNKVNFFEAQSTAYSVLPTLRDFKQQEL